MKNNYFWDTISNYMKIKTIIPAVILIIVGIVFIDNAIFDKILS